MNTLNSIITIPCTPRDYRLCIVNKKTPAFALMFFNVVLKEGGGGGRAIF